MEQERQRNLDVVCVGGVAVDRVYRLSHLPEPGSGAHVKEIDKFGGGVEANVSAALARLGGRVGLVSRVGDDADGRWVRDDLRAWGVDVRRVMVMPGATTDSCLVWVAPDGERMLACHNPSLQGMRLEAHDRAFLARARVLFLSSFVPLKLIREAIRAGRTAGLAIAFDLSDSFEDLVTRGLKRDDFWELAPAIDLLMTNHIGLTSLMELEQPESAFDAFRRRASQVSLAMTMGAEGAWLSHQDQQAFVDAFQVQAIDTTGAGDAFHAGLIFGSMLQAWPLRRAGLFASALAALNCMGLGARGGLVGRDEVMRFLAVRGFDWR